MIKRIVAGALAVWLIFSCAACAAPKQTESDKLQVICSVFPPYDFVRQIAGDAAQITLLLVPGQECHSYEPSPKDIMAIQSCDLFIYVGGESEDWVTDLLSTVADDGPRTLKLMDCVQTVKEELAEGMEGEAEDAPDEHVWTSPENAVTIVQHITDILCELDKTNAAAFRAASADYTAKLNALHTAFQNAVAAADTRTLVFADRFPFRYFADSYGLSCYAPFPGCSHHAEPSAATVAFLIDKMRAEELSVVLYIEFSNQKIADSLCEATGAEKRLFHSCHNVTADELAAGETYLSLMSDNLAVLKEALSV